MYWVLRVHKLKKAVGGSFTANTRTRAWISAFIDNDSPVYTIAKMYAQSFLFLGGLQYNYELTFSVMLIVFAVESTLDSLRVLLAFWDTDSLHDVVLTSSSLEASMRINMEKSQHSDAVIQLRPRNVYVSRHFFVVLVHSASSSIHTHRSLSNLYTRFRRKTSRGTSSLSLWFSSHNVFLSLLW